MKHLRNLSGRKSKRHLTLRLVLIAIILAFTSILFLRSENLNNEHVSHDSQEATTVDSNDVVIPKRIAEVPAGDSSFDKKPPESKEPILWKSVVIQPGDNLSLIFQRMKFSRTLLNRLISLDKKNQALPQLRPGRLIRFGLREEKIETIAIEVDELSSLWFEMINGRLTSRLESIEPTKKLATASSVINDSLFADGQEVGLSDATIMQLTDIFAWDIDFALDLRRGDSFTIIYERVYKGSEYLRAGKILAAEFVNKGRVSRAAIYPMTANVTAYYTPTGEAMKKAFLRAPVEFSRISSRFSLKRRHPILNKIRAHTGVDYAAPLGTPVRATSEGKVKSIGWNGSYGKTIVLNHGHRYSTLYAHLARYNRKLKFGSYVKQGQVIGYVGKTGLATGPHLHYEFRIDGRHKNPLTVKFPPADPIAKNLYEDFKKDTTPLFKHLDLLAKKEKSSATKLAARAKMDEHDYEQFSSSQTLN